MSTYIRKYPRLEQIINTHDKILKTQLVFYVDGSRHVIGKGFVSDGASRPDFMWRYIDRWGWHKYADIVHDYLYQTGLYSRQKSDKIFSILLHQEAPKGAVLKPHLMYAGVRLFGHKFFKS